MLILLLTFRKTDFLWRHRQNMMTSSKNKTSYIYIFLSLVWCANTLWVNLPTPKPTYTSDAPQDRVKWSFVIVLDFFILERSFSFAPFPRPTKMFEFFQSSQYNISTITELDTYEVWNIIYHTHTILQYVIQTEE